MKWMPLGLMLVVACSSHGSDSTKKERPTSETSSARTTSISTTPTALATTTPSASPTITTTGSVAGAPRSGWPLPPVDCVMAGQMKACRVGGEPGVQCPGAACVNPCPVGMAPGVGLSMCERLCKSKAECGAGTCTAAGVCDTIPKLPCEGGPSCALPNGQSGFDCGGTCYNPCKPTHGLYGGTHCAKICKDNADCPGGECADNYCTPLCWAEGCPYPWE